MVAVKRIELSHLEEGLRGSCDGCSLEQASGHGPVELLHAEAANEVTGLEWTRLRLCGGAGGDGIVTARREDAAGGPPTRGWDLPRDSLQPPALPNVPDRCDQPSRVRMARA